MFVQQPPIPQTLQLKVLGLYTNNNELSAAPDGALEIADNIWISKDSIAESRRGFGFLEYSLPLPLDRADKLSTFQNFLLVHYNNSNTGSLNDKLAYYNPSNGINIYSGSYKHPDPLLGRMKFAESNQNIYFTTALGIYKNDLITNNPVPAGMYPALDCTATSSASASGFMLNNAQVAYRAVWGITDANNNLNLGSPSFQAVISNTSGSVQNVSLAITIPEGITTNHLFQLYRSDQAQAITSNATLTVQDITYTAVTAGTAGNSVSIAYTTGATAGSEVVSVVGSAISVQIASGTSANQATLTTAGLTYTAIATGSAGNAIAIVYFGGGTAGSEVVTVGGNIISVKLQSGTSTATQVAAAINASPSALSLVTVTVNTGATTQSTMNPTYLNGGSTAAQILAAVNASAQAIALVTPTISGLSTNFQIAPFSTANLSGGSITMVAPDDNCQLVYQANPTSGQISAKSITVIDDTPDSLRGAALYTNATQQGILQENTMPPYALDIALFSTCMFYANVQTPQQMFLNILAVGGSSGITSGDTVTIAGTTYTAGSSQNVGTLTFQVFTSGSAAQNINDTALSLVQVINQNSTNTTVYAYYLSSVNSLPGQLMIQARTVGTSVFSATASAHGSAYSPALPTSGTSVGSSNNTFLNGLMYSKANQPEAVPSTNILYIGSAAKKILRIIPVRNSLFVLKEDGVFSVTGVPGNWTVNVVDSTIFLLAPESAVALSNQVFCLTTQGVVAINDTGGAVLSRPIENQLLELEGAGLSNLKYYSFGVAYESERQYVLWTISSASDTFGTQAFIYNTFTKTWTRSTRQQVHGIVTPTTFDNTMYVLNENSNNISQERKSFTYLDYVDEAFSNNIATVNGLTLTLTEVNSISVGDLIYQSSSTNSVVTAVNPTNSTVTVAPGLTGWTTGACTQFKSIPCTIQWLPNTSGNPGYLRHWAETTLILKQNLFYSASMNFFSEIDYTIDQAPIVGNNSLGWGLFAWGNAPWGSVVNSKPFRTYVPRNKQCCDLLTVQFVCQSAYAQFQVEGISSIFSTISERMTR